MVAHGSSYLLIPYYTFLAVIFLDVKTLTSTIIARSLSKQSKKG
jgi:hypothetical protein